MDRVSGIVELICRETGRKDGSLTGDSLVSEIGLDSLGFMDLIMRIEEGEAVTLTDAQIERILSASHISEIALVFSQAQRAIHAPNAR